MMERVRQVRAENPQLLKLATQAWLVGTLASGLIVWFGGIMLGPGAHIAEIDKRLSASLDTLEQSVRSAHATKAASEVVQDENIAALRQDLLTVLTLQCSSAAVQRIRERGQYAAAARCESLVATGR